MLNLLKSPVYFMAAITVYLFSLGYLYEYSYLDQFGIKEKIFLVEYSTFLVYSFHVLIYQFLNNQNIVVGAALVAAFIFILRNVLKRNLKARNFIERHIVKHLNRTIIYSYLIMFSPVFLTLLILIPVHFGSKEASELKSNIDKNWQVIVFNDKSEMEGVVIRIIKDQVIFLEKNDSVVHSYNMSGVKDIKSRSKP